MNRENARRNSIYNFSEHYRAHVKYHLFGYSKDYKERCQYKRSYCGWEIPFGAVWIAGADSGLTTNPMKEIKDSRPDRFNHLGNIFKHSGVWTSSVKHFQCFIFSLSAVEYDSWGAPWPWPTSAPGTFLLLLSQSQSPTADTLQAGNKNLK